MERRLATVGFALIAAAAVAALSVLAMANAPPEHGDAFAELAFWTVQAAGIGFALVAAGAVFGTVRDGWGMLRRPRP